MIKTLRFLTPAVMILAVISAFCIARLHLRIPAIKAVPGWKEDFSGRAHKTGKSIIPQGWILRNKIGTPPTVFTVEKDNKDNTSYLRMKAVKSSGSIITRFDDGGLEKMPILRWRWRAKELPQGGDGRFPGKDDQAAGIYIGTGNMLNQKSISYRWDTDTPKGAEGNCAYGAGGFKVKWYTLRNKDDVKSGEWYTEERNYMEDFKKAWGFYPQKLYLGIISNSQYTASDAMADIDWIELTFSPQATSKPKP